MPYCRNPVHMHRHKISLRAPGPSWPRRAARQGQAAQHQRPLAPCLFEQRKALDFIGRTFLAQARTHTHTHLCNGSEWSSNTCSKTWSMCDSPIQYRARCVKVQAGAPRLNSWSNRPQQTESSERAATTNRLRIAHSCYRRSTWRRD